MTKILGLALMLVACGQPRDSDLNSKPTPFSAKTIVSLKTLEKQVYNEEQTCVWSSKGIIGQTLGTEKRILLFESLRSKLKLMSWQLGFSEKASMPKWTPKNPKKWTFDLAKGEKKYWRFLTRVKSDDQKCAALRSAYIYSVLQLSIVRPTKPIEKYSDILVKDKPTEDVWRDRARAVWQLRFMRFTPKRLFPKKCDYLYKESKARYQFVLSDRKPLGYAIGMCGRPMNAHYIDDDVASEKRQEPAGWDKKSIRD